MPTILPKPTAIQRERLAESRAAWQPPGTNVEIQGRAISGGMIYSGPHLRALESWFQDEPALIDPTLKVRKQTHRPGRRFSQWQLHSYQVMTAYDRASMLDWLANGRPGGLHPHELTLFLYGLERRIFFDARFDEQALAELPVLLDEIGRLLADAKSAQEHWAISTLTALHSATASRIPGFDLTTLPPPMTASGWSMPLSLELVLGACTLEKRPLPAIWAYSWVICSPESYMRTVERRCPEEFAQYFEHEYRRRYGEGIVLPYIPDDSTLTYPPLNPSFDRTFTIGPRRMPLIDSPTEYPELIAMVERVSAELQDFVRSAGPHHGQPVLSAYGYLPRAFELSTSHPRIASLAATSNTALADNSFGIIEKSALLEHFPETGAQPSPKQATGIARLMGKLGFGLEPDPETMRTPFLRAEQLGIYRVESDHGKDAQSLEPETLLALLSIWSYIAASDGPIEERTTLAVCSILIDQSQPLHIDRNRLHAQAAWLARYPATLAEARRRFDSAGDWKTDKIAWIMVALAHLDATMTPDRIKALAKIYTLLGSTSEQLHADLHRFSTSTQAPTQIIDGEPVAGFGIPAAPDPHEVTLDTSRLASVREQTAAISSVLHDIFAGAEPKAPATETVARPAPANDPYDQLLELLSRQPSWTMAEIEDMASPAGLMAAGAIETINDRAIARGLDPLLDCDDVICDVYAPTLNDLLDRH